VLATVLMLLYITVAIPIWTSNQLETGSQSPISGEIQRVDDVAEKVQPSIDSRDQSRPAAKTLDRITIFFFDPVIFIPSRRALRPLFRIVPLRPEEGQSLIDLFDPVRFPYRHLIPLQDAQAIHLSQHYDRMGDEYATVVNYSTMNIISNKKRFAQFLRDHGFRENVPAEYHSPEEVSDFPVIIKLTNGTGTRGTFLVNDESELNSAISQLNGQEYIIQEFIANRTERAVHVSAIHGRMIRLVCHQRNLGHSLFLAEGRTRSIPPDLVDKRDCHEDLYRRMVKAINFTGIGNFDVRLKTLENGTVVPFVIEMNPRVPGSIARNVSLLADMLCSLQWNGNGVASPNGCVEKK